MTEPEVQPQHTVEQEAGEAPSDNADVCEIDVDAFEEMESHVEELQGTEFSDDTVDDQEEEEEDEDEEEEKPLPDPYEGMPLKEAIVLFLDDENAIFTKRFAERLMRNPDALFRYVSRLCVDVEADEHEDEASNEANSDSDSENESEDSDDDFDDDSDDSDDDDSEDDSDDDLIYTLSDGRRVRRVASPAQLLPQQVHTSRVFNLQQLRDSADAEEIRAQRRSYVVIQLAAAAAASARKQCQRSPMSALLTPLGAGPSVNLVDGAALLFEAATHCAVSHSLAVFAGASQGNPLHASEILRLLAQAQPAAMLRALTQHSELRFLLHNLLTEVRMPGELALHAFDFVVALLKCSPGADDAVNELACLQQSFARLLVSADDGFDLIGRSVERLETAIRESSEEGVRAEVRLLQTCVVELAARTTSPRLFGERRLARALTALARATVSALSRTDSDGDSDGDARDQLAVLALTVHSHVIDPMRMMLQPPQENLLRRYRKDVFDAVQQQLSPLALVTSNMPTDTARGLHLRSLVLDILIALVESIRNEPFNSAEAEDGILDVTIPLEDEDTLVQDDDAVSTWSLLSALSEADDGAFWRSCFECLVDCVRADVFGAKFAAAFALLVDERHDSLRFLLGRDDSDNCDILLSTLLGVLDGTSLTNIGRERACQLLALLAERAHFQSMRLRVLGETTQVTAADLGISLPEPPEELLAASTWSNASSLSTLAPVDSDDEDNEALRQHLAMQQQLAMEHICAAEADERRFDLAGRLRHCAAWSLYEEELREWQQRTRARLAVNYADVADNVSSDDDEDDEDIISSLAHSSERVGETLESLSDLQISCSDTSDDDDTSDDAEDPQVFLRPPEDEAPGAPIDDEETLRLMADFTVADDDDDEAEETKEGDAADQVASV
ncbi:MAG: hypothetical protein MHM6MM_004724 [Cercozoa sp. M6MM]